MEFLNSRNNPQIFAIVEKQLPNFGASMSESFRFQLFNDLYLLLAYYKQQHNHF
jgi:hypothetical protein